MHLNDFEAPPTDTAIECLGGRIDEPAYPAQYFADTFCGSDPSAAFSYCSTPDQQQQHSNYPPLPTDSCPMWAEEVTYE